MIKSAKLGVSSIGLSIVLALSSATNGWSQQPPAPPKAAIPQFPPGPDFAGVAGSAAERVRVAALCGPNRNANDGYAPPPAFPGQTKAPIVHGTQGYAIETVAKIDRPWGMTFLPDGKMLVSFRDGGMRVVDKNGAVSEPVANVPQMVQPRLGSGMYGVILDRNFARNRTIYFGFHTRLPGDPAAMGRIVSAKLSVDEKSLDNLKTLREGVDIQPRALVQARDGTLLVLSAGLSDAGPEAQDLKSQLGKVLRINTDGAIPKDNPFLSTPDANPAIWALGFRDIHSALIHPKTGELWVAENVPKGGDEINVMRKGKNYGFAQISYGRQNSGAMINGGKTAQEGMEQPLYYWNPSIAPSGLMLYTGNAFPGWKNDLFVGGLSGMQVTRLVMNGEKVVAEEKLLMDRCERIKVINQGPDGDIYILTDQMPPNQNEVLRLVPAKSIPSPRVPSGTALATATPATSGQAPGATPTPPSGALPPATPEELTLGGAAFGRVCAACHGAQGGGAIGPNIAARSDVAFVADIIRSGEGAMPSFATALSDAEINAIPKYISRLPR
ncbi:MAG TPA: PQQ-dependent sugar dehydrogenase [Phenylobacterium sp.]|nr:PQQ-dependent sugar dehydrogenase [Phenylobacterium sp.]